MSHRQMSRPSERDQRLHDPTPIMSSHPPPPAALAGPPAHINGSSSSAPPSGPAVPNGAGIVSPAVAASSAPNGVASSSNSIINKLNVANEQTWLLIGRVAEQMGDLDHALSAYESALRHNPVSLSGLTQVAGIARIKENYPKAVEYFQRVIQLQEDNGEVWSALGHCYLMQDDLQKAYSAYQQALYLLPNPKEDPKLWYGIGILYDRYGSLDHAEEAFSSVLRMEGADLDFDKSNEILFRLGIIYKQQCKYDDSLHCFDRILRNPPSPLAHADIWFQIGHVFEQQKDYVRAKDAYERVVAENPGHAKVLQQLGWLYHQDGSSFQNQDTAIQYLTKSLEADPSDAQSWYLLGRAYMAGQKYNKAYEAYQQAVYRDGRNPTFWCSIGVLYFQINQFRDALDAYSRAIRINPYISEVWFDLGSLYESCNNQISDAIDAYARAAELDPSNTAITQRLQLLRNAQATGTQLPSAPGPQDVHPTAYASAVVPPQGLSGPPLLLQSSAHRLPFRAESRGSGHNEIALPPPAQNGRSSPGPFGGRPPPPVVIDESRHAPNHTPLAPMEVDRPLGRDYPPPPSRDSRGGPVGHQSLLQHPVPQQQPRVEELRTEPHGHRQHDPYFARRPGSRSPSPPRGHPASHARSPSGASAPPPQFYPSRQPVGPAQPASVPPQRSPRMYAPSRHDPGRPVDAEPSWEARRPPTADHRDSWEKEGERRGRHPGDYPPPPQPGGHYATRSPATSHARPHSPDPSPRNAGGRYWESKPPVPPMPHSASHGRPSPPPPARYDPRMDSARDQRGDYEMASPEARHTSRPGPPPMPIMGPGPRGSESPNGDNSRRRQSGRDFDQLSASPVPMQQDAAKRDKKNKPLRKRRDDRTGSETPKPSVGPERVGSGMGQYKYKNGPGSPEQSSQSSRSVQQSPISATPRLPNRITDDDYDAEDVVATNVLMSLSSYKPPASGPGSVPPEPAHSPTVSSGSRHSDPSPRPPVSHRNSVSSSKSHMSPPPQPANLKRPLSPSSDESETKRSRVDGTKRSSPTGGRGTPIISTRPSPIPFRTQAVPAHSPEQRQLHEPPYPSSPPPPLAHPALPPHPRPVGNGHSSSSSSVHTNGSANIALPPIATLPQTSSPHMSPSDRERDDRMQVDGPRGSPKASRTSEAPASRSPPSKQSSPRAEAASASP